ncbi:hypothetical protein BH23DEI1_BH23DEI1_21030 [soil metagenome]|nr:FAD/NAD(P)-binding protein [Trueperaceae bacterium]
MRDVPITVVGGRGPHGLALHLWLADRGLAGCAALVDPAPHWLPTYDDAGPARATVHLRSPRELDFALGDPSRSMTCWRDADGSRPLADVYCLGEAEDPHANATVAPSRRVGRHAFWRYANDVARRSGADQHVREARVERLVPAGDRWLVHLDDGDTFRTAVVLLASGIVPHLRLPEPWRAWWCHLPPERATHALAASLDDASLPGSSVAILGSSNAATWELACAAARRGAAVTIVCRRGATIERQLPFDPAWFRTETMRAFIAQDPKVRLRTLKKTHIPRSTLPGSTRRAAALGVRVLPFARVRFATPLWGGIQLQWADARGERAERFDRVWASTGVEPRPRALPFMRDAVGGGRGPVVIGGPARHLPVMDDAGRWKGMPPLYPLGHLALPRCGLAAATLASAGRYLPLLMDDVLADAGIDPGARAMRPAPDPLIPLEDAA